MRQITVARPYPVLRLWWRAVRMGMTGGNGAGKTGTGMSGQAEKSYDAVVIGSGLGGLTAAALLAQEGRRVCVLEGHTSMGGAASCYRVGSLTIEASLHETADPHDPRDPKHAILKKLGLLDELDWVKVPALQTIVGGPLGDTPFVLPHDFGAAQAALTARFPAEAAGIARLMARMREAYDTLGQLQGAADAPSLMGMAAAAPALVHLLGQWRQSLGEVLEQELKGNEAAKCALAGNLLYYGDDPALLWWLFFAAAQGGYIGSGGVYVRGGSAALSRALARLVKRKGGDVLMGRKAVAVETGADGAPVAVRHLGKDGVETRFATRTVLANCAPQLLAEMLPEGVRAGFAEPYRDKPLSVSLFSAHFGLAVAPQRFGLQSYSTVILPGSMTALADFAQAGAAAAGLPGDSLPPLTVVNYGAIDSGLDNGDLTLVTVVGLDRVANWQGMAREDEQAKRAAWLSAIEGELERRYPGFAGAVKEKVFVSARSMRSYLETPDGAVYGFAPEVPEHSFLAGSPRSVSAAVPGLYLASAFGGFGGFSGAMGAGGLAARAAERFLKDGG